MSFVNTVNFDAVENEAKYRLTPFVNKFNLNS